MSFRTKNSRNWASVSTKDLPQPDPMRAASVTEAGVEHRLTPSTFQMLEPLLNNCPVEITMSTTHVN